MNFDDQTITAFVLGELQGVELEAFEQELAINPKLQAEVEEIRQFTTILQNELKNSNDLGLNPNQRQKILNPPKPLFWKWLPITITASAAAMILIGINWQAGNKSLGTTNVAKNEETHNNKKDTTTLPNKVVIESKFVEVQKEEEVDFEFKLSENAPVPAKPQEAFKKKADANSLHYYSYVDASEGEIIVSGSAIYNQLEKLQVDNKANTERYGSYIENVFKLAQVEPLSTFSIDVDNASYTNLRTKLRNGQLPHKDAVRIEEMINYFDYNYSEPANDLPFAVHTEVAESPWSPHNKLVKIALQAKKVNTDKRPNSNLVFLIDVSGSMNSSDKLPLLKEGFQKMVSQLNENDRVGIVVYAGNAGVLLEPTVCDSKGRDLIIGKLAQLESGGSTNGAGGIKEAYSLVQKNFLENGTNRVILATDGDFNVGMSSDNELINLIKEKAKEKSYLTVLGFGQGNLNDRMMEEISNQGNGNYYFIDSALESTRVLCTKISGTLVTIAKDVKIQVDFNPANVHSYRLVGYDNRVLKNEDFNDDKKDAGEIGAGHTVTAFYEIVPVGSANARPQVDDSKYTKDKKVVETPKNEYGNELLTVKIRYKAPEGGESKLLTFPTANKSEKFEKASKDFIFSASVAAFGMVLKNSENVGDLTYRDIETWLTKTNATNDIEQRVELLNLIKLANTLKNQ